MSSGRGTEPLDRLVYVSLATRPVTSVMQMSDILHTARPNNARDGITGALTAVESRFVQVVEGAPNALDDLLRRLKDDDRHRDIEVLERRPVPTRAFPGWDMVSPRLAAADIRILGDLIDTGRSDLDGYVALLSGALERQGQALLGETANDPVDGLPGRAAAGAPTHPRVED